ncbi:DUF6527 family protein [Anatilimnocola sp. NA78]|uniref:DUF6527 family protein n=1 Tax=Anatilimnocola sp. NA78 TaxID=3415683 RepID=UPI003CE535A3
MKAQPLKITDTGYTFCEAAEATHVMLNMPGPIPTRIIPVMIGGTRAGTGNWTWNGSVDSPTLKPSILTRSGHENKPIVCHTFVNDGLVQFLGDCTHELAGQTVPLLDVDESHFPPK